LVKRIRQAKWAYLARKNYATTRRTITRVQPEVVYIWGLRHVSITPALAAIDSGSPCVFRLEDYWLAGLKRELCLETNVVKKVFRRALIGLRDFERVEQNLMLCVSHALMKSHLEVGFPASKIAVLPEGFAEETIMYSEALTQWPQTANRFRMVYLGRLDNSKGVDVAIKATNEIIRQNAGVEVGLDVIGTGSSDYLQALQRLVSSLSLTHSVRFLGFMEHRQALRQLETYDLLLFPSLWVEPFGNVVGEAMARGVIVVASDQGGPAEIITHGVTGLLVEPGSALAMAEAVSTLIRNDIPSMRMRLAALETIRERYGQTGKIDAIESRLRSAMG
jgi:glycosyltransferase involved in cell wall biosynthesis